MKNLRIKFTLSTSIVFLILFLMSCETEELSILNEPDGGTIAGDNIPDDINTTNLSIEISSSELFEDKLGAFGFEEGAVISVQAKHAKVSKIERDGIDISYIYQAEENYKGDDYVEIRIEKGSNGADPGTTHFVKINFSVN